MNGAHWHLVLNHFPFIGGIFSLAVLLGGYLFKNQSVKLAGLVLILLTGMLTIPVFYSGEEAEEVLEAIGQKNNTVIHPHEEAAETALWVMESAAGFALISLLMFMRKRKHTEKLTLITLVILFVATGMMMNVNNLGGKIRHTEIRE